MQTNLVSSLVNSLNELKSLLEVRESELQEAKKKNDLLELNIVDLSASLKGYRERCFFLEKSDALEVKKVDKKLSKSKKLQSKFASSLEDEEESEEDTIPTPSQLIKTLGLKKDIHIGLYHPETSLVFKVFNIKGTDSLVCIGRLVDDGSNGQIRSIYGQRTNFWHKKLNLLAEQKKIGYLLDLADEYSRLGLEDRTEMSLKGLADF